MWSSLLPPWDKHAPRANHTPFARLERLLISTCLPFARLLFQRENIVRFAAAHLLAVELAAPERARINRLSALAGRRLHYDGHQQQNGRADGHHEQI